jgi:hypothetical protein
MDSIESQLREKRQALESFRKKAKHNFSPEEFHAALEDVLRLERLVAEKKEEPYATKWLSSPAWEGMTLDCTVFGNQSTCLVQFETKPKSGRINIIEFGKIAGYKLTDINDEVLDAHPFAGRGLTAYGAFIIHNSPWLREIEAINESHPQYSTKQWQKSHYMLCFKDRLFESIAGSFEFLGTYETVQAATRTALERIGVTS